jgi:HAD superfamily hydrolase (TIGR01484 family)
LNLKAKSPIHLLSTDFDGTLHAEYESPPVPHELQDLIGSLQSEGMTWIINTGRDLTSLMETLNRAELSIFPDYVVTVEREIHVRTGTGFAGLEPWNSRCRTAHEELFARVRPDLPRLIQWVNARFQATVYEDPFSPLCVIARNNPEADLIQAYFDQYCREIPGLVFVRNDIYARFSHQDFSKGTALGEIARRLGLSNERIVAAGDHMNDLPMLSRTHARWLLAPANAIPSVKEAVRRQQGFVSDEPYGFGVMQGLARLLKALAHEDQLT